MYLRCGFGWVSARSVVDFPQCAWPTTNTTRPLLMREIPLRDSIPELWSLYYLYGNVPSAVGLARC